MTQMNRVEEAKQYLQETIGICDRFPHEKAKALMMLGELYRTSRVPDYELAYECHREAIRLADALVKHSNPTVQLTAKDVLFEAHLATAKAIAWGRWDKKEEAIEKWINQAKVWARDPDLLAARRYSKEYQFKIAACALATLVAVPEKLNIDLYIEDVIDAGNKLIKSTIESTNDPILRAKYHWDTGISVYDAVQIFFMRQQYSSALRYGELAANYMEIGIKDRNSDTDSYLLGRLYFRLGVIHAIGNQNHRAAIEWYDSARPIFEKLLPKIDTGALGLFGETLVSMGVSYWETDRREDAVYLTERGLRQLERGVRANVIDPSVLKTPYTNLAKMYHELNDPEQAAKYMRFVSSIGSEDKRIR
jgi:tetratricopeptide (TPR) repeat protein